ncbi:uncharacterized protein LOC110456679 [Mizuhopecten yessoensis]|uniref:Uncharacterized protein n=1 Tax=Mizuhopecten yessoensis TaxID=6573 RepID=A0A210R404_MIZYE|nr:uncharacterized protein LOC110456679 [Mizuhopecten yessoensis]OWF55686.1 hypothetical protein KP79_PYT09620 [Mizuhopecten yessoensis]
MMLWLVLIGTLSLVVGRPQSPRRYLTIHAGSTTYYGNMASVYVQRNVEVPTLHNLKYDTILDIALYDQITIEEHGLYEVYNDPDRPVKFVTGDKVLMWVYNPNTLQFRNVLSVMFANDADFRVFKRILQQYVNG